MNRSETIAELAKSLVKFNLEVNKIAKDADNPFFKNNYATLDTIIDEIRPILSKHGLSIMQIPSGDGQNVTLKTLLLHETGEWLESDELTMKPVKNDPQAVGSCITYARRYSLAAFLSLNTGEDDDGN
ncbi:ERF family protein, partial [Bacillus thuringiensis]|uniref:ERF family protein n=2 Tax=Bacillaceae TaxID=186817 RepID=UPI0005AB6A9E